MRFAQAAAEISATTGKPILTATELAVAIPDNAGPQAVRATGRLCYASSNRAVTALGHLYRYARFRDAPRPWLNHRAAGRPEARCVRRVLAGALVVAAIAAIVVALRAPEGARAPAPMGTLATPLWSPRRTPQPLVDLVGDARPGRVAARCGERQPGLLRRP